MVLSVSDGMIKGITERMIGLSSSHASCFFSPMFEGELDSENLYAVAEKFKNEPGITNAYPEVRGIGLASSLAGRTGATIRAVTKNAFEENASYKKLFKIIEGSASLQEKNSAVIGEKLAKTLNLSAGKTLRLITSREGADGKILPKITSLKVAGIVSSGYQELDALWLFIPLEMGLSILPVSSSEIFVGIETPDAYSIELDKTVSRFEEKFGDQFEIYKWNEMNVAEYENFASTQIMLLFIMLLIVLVASVNISSALVMLVMERRKEIAILKSLGSSPSEIALSFLLTGLATGGAGVLIGIPAGLFCAANFNWILTKIEIFVNYFVEFIYLAVNGNVENFTHINLLDPAFYLQEIPLSIPLGQLIIITAGTLILSLLVSALPALKAGKEKPIDVLRKI